MTRKEERESRIKVIIEQRRTCQGRKETGGWYYKDWWLNGAEWADKTFLQKACEWLKENCKSYIIVDIDNKYKGLDGLFLKDFRKYMEGE